ncbi:MAG: tRNA pseudouridine(55) synthase TruB [Alphaproteobacteria bacterium]|nr:tRNA pseudouridine(55) synthase TruB [Alphaproteobacteria bacterium]
MSKLRHSYHGWINLHKPLHLTSADAVFQVKRLIHPTKIGHAGTLDPLATGVLPLALGEGTKCVNLLMDAKKTYEFSVTFGERRTTDDAEGEVVETSETIPTAEEIRAVLPRFTGEIMQTPPIYSALKVAGKRAYDLARAGEEVVLAPRPVTVYALECLRGDVPSIAHFRAVVSKGTYIRSLGRDIAQALGSQGYISRLHRAAVGPFCDTDAISLDFLAESVHKAPPSGESPWLTPLLRALDDIPAVALNGGQLQQLRHGQRVALGQPHPDTPQIAVVHAGQLAALARVEGNQVIPVRLLVL